MIEKIFQMLTILAITTAIIACSNSKKTSNKEGSFPPNAPKTNYPNCSADGEGCQQFNPNL